MANRPNHSLPNKHTLYIGGTGSGKSQALKQNKAIPKSGARVVLWDSGEDHKAIRCRSLLEFARAYHRALMSGKGFRLALTLPGEERTPEAHERFCKLIWLSLDGRYPVYMIDEELCSVCSSHHRAARYHALLVNEGRKYGLIYHGTIQYPQELPKTVYRACNTLWCGRQDVEAVEYVSKRLGVAKADIAALEPLEFYVQNVGSGEPVKKIKLRYVKK